MPPGPAVHRYGPHPDQFLELTLPGTAGGPVPVVVVVHGGFWRAAYGVELARPLAASLAADGCAAVAVEYRRVGAGGGWPQTLEDVAAALDALPALPEAAGLDLTGVAVVGHSAGGHLAAWAAARGRLPAGAPGAGPRVHVTAAVLQAGVLDLELAHEQRLSSDAVLAFLGGGPDEVPDRYAATSPVRLLPVAAEVLCVHGEQDTDVPPEHTRRYAAAAAAAGRPVEVRIVPADHMALIDPSGEPWRLVRDWLHRRLGARPERSTLEP